MSLSFWLTPCYTTLHCSFMPLANKPSATYFTHLMGSWQEKALLNTEHRFLTVLLTLLPRSSLWKQNSVSLQCSTILKQQVGSQKISPVLVIKSYYIRHILIHKHAYADTVLHLTYPCRAKVSNPKALSLCQLSCSLFWCKITINYTMTWRGHDWKCKIYVCLSPRILPQIPKEKRRKRR